MLDDLKVSFAGHTFDCLDKGFNKNEPVDVVIRPEDVDIVAPEKGMLKGTVTSVTFMGVHNEAIVDINGFKWMIQTTDPVIENSFIGISLDPDAMEAIARQPESAGDIRSNMIVIAALVEGVALFAVIVCILALFV